MLKSIYHNEDLRRVQPKKEDLDFLGVPWGLGIEGFISIYHQATKNSPREALFVGCNQENRF